MKPPCALILALYLTSPVFAQQQPQANAEDAKLNAYFKQYLDEELKNRPLTATWLGDRRFDHLLDDVSPKTRAASLERWKATLKYLQANFEAKKLSRSTQIDLEIWQHDLKRTIWLTENMDPFRHDPRVYNDYISDSVYLPLTQSTLPKEKVIKNCIARMAHMPAILEVAKKELKNPPAILLDSAINQNRGAIRFFEAGLLDLVGNSPQKEEVKEAAAKVVVALRDYHKFLEGLIPEAKGDWRIGKEKFARKLELELDAGLTMEQVLKEAESEFARVVRDMYVIARQLWSQAYPGKPLPPDDAEGRKQTIQKVLDHFNQHHGKEEDLVRDATAGISKIKDFIKKNDILKLPEPDRCQIIEMPEFQRGFSVAYLNQAPPLDSAARSVYAISPPPSEWDSRRRKTFMEEYNRYMLFILSIHEAYPGHYVQLEYSNRHPSLIRKVLSSGVFSEGWAVYTEQMMLDQGFGEGSLPMRLNQLKFYLRAVANAILDYRMHCTNYSDKDALRFLTDEVFQSEGEAVGKITRAKLSSCQLSTYFVGRTAFYKLRQEVEREQGDKFSLGRYHEAVLDHGTLPVKYLPEVVRERLKQPR